MIHSLLIEELPDFALPMYDIPPFYSGVVVLRGIEGELIRPRERTVTWQPIRNIRHNSVLIPTDMDNTLYQLSTLIPYYIAELNRLLPDTPGTLMLIVRSCATMNMGDTDVFEHNRYLCGGLAFFPDTSDGPFFLHARLLNNENPSDLILQYVRDNTLIRNPELIHQFEYSEAQLARARERANDPEFDIANLSANFIRSNEEREKAKAVARELLVSCLNEEQRRNFENSGTFPVTAKDGRYFVIKSRYAMGVTEVAESEEIPQSLVELRDFCVVINAPTPLFDQMLAQKLLLETNPEEFYRIANVHEHSTRIPSIDVINTPQGFELRQIDGQLELGVL